jgi:nucleoside-diphosphate-sugar epimerase
MTQVSTEMKVLFTGASSGIGRRVLEEVLKSDRGWEIWCTRHKHDVPISESRVRVVDLDITSDAGMQAIPEGVDLIVHFAGVTHAQDAARYWTVNHEGTARLAEAARAQGCRRFVYISTRCATRGAGAYGESKLAAEAELQNMDWESLLIIRPAEVYGAGSNEGIDRWISLAERWHLAPVVFGDSNIEFAPLHARDFAALAAEALTRETPGQTILEMCGPEDLDGQAIGLRLAKHYVALPIPVWWPGTAVLLNAGLNLGVPDQAQRLTCSKTASARTANAIGRIRFLEN